ncbi:hypothetical protein DENSPDRAFT_57546 [Dentipellis sp. KUC8613]|nr:hypothetical protein DENSPDRAFT_57546 [Dentipellis sp. KUC8613]
MESLSPLRTLLKNAISPGSVTDEQELFDLLVLYRPALVKLFEVKPPNDADRKELQSGKINVNGRSFAVNAEFTNQVVALANTLNCSEHYVAVLAHDLLTENPNLNPKEVVEAVVLEHHRRRRDLVDCLRFLIEAAEYADSPLALPLHKKLGAFVETYFVPEMENDKGLAARILSAVQGMEQVITQAQTAKQNAQSNTVIQGANVSLSQDVHAARLESLKLERRSLATVLYLLARQGHLHSPEVERIVPWLQQNNRHSMTYYLLATLLVAFDPSDPDSLIGQRRQRLATEPSTLNLMKNRLNLQAAWTEGGLKATILLKWTLFLTEVRHREPTLEHKEGFKSDELETNVWNAVQGDVFSYLAVSVAKLQRKEGLFPPGSYAASALHLPETEQHQEPPEDDFKPAILQTFETLVRSAITHASSELRKIKQRQEDFTLANARSDRSRMFRSTTARAESTSAPPQQPRNDIAMLFSFIGILYTNLPPERALQFWGAGPSDSQKATYTEVLESSAGRLPAFLQWAVWSTQPRDADMSIALYDMLAGLAKGQQCSELAYNFLVRGGGEVVAGSMLPNSGSSSYASGAIASWATIFGLLDSWVAAGTNVRQGQQFPQGSISQMGFLSTHQGQQNQQQLVLSNKDVWLAQCFLRLLSTVVSFSVAARIALGSHSHMRVIPTLLSLIHLGIALELKASVFESLAAFCEPGAGSAGVDICRSVWIFIERSELIQVRGGGSLAKKGIEAELELVEEANRVYPETISFVKLLSTLIHTPKRVPLKSRIIDGEPGNTIPEGLGHPYRQPGIGPYVAFVIDEVFLKIPTRDYNFPRERWQLNDLCLSFMERCLASYDLESLASAEDQQISGDVLTPFFTHPGFDIMQRLLTNSALQASILTYLVDGVDGFDKGFGDDEPIFPRTIVRVLRIIHRVLEIQDVYLDVLIPLLTQFNSSTSIGTIHPRSYFTKLDQALSFAPQYAPALAAYVTYASHSELQLLSIKVLTLLAKSTAFPNLTTLLERSSDSVRIIDGYRRILEVDADDNLDVAEADADQYTGAGAPDVEYLPDTLSQAVRVAALDLLIQNTQSGFSYPNVAHLILLGSTTSGQIQDPHALGSARAPIHVILDWLNMGIPRQSSKGKQREQANDVHAVPLFLSLPEIAERYYRVVYQLCMHPRTSDFTMRYLRTREDFFARQLAVLPYKAPEVQEPTIEVQYSDGARVATSVSALTSFLRLRSYIFDLVALDLHALTNRGHYKSVAELLELIYGNEEQQFEDEDWEDQMFRPFRETGQSHMRIVEFVQSMSFDWADSLSLENVDLQLLGGLNLGTCVRVDEKGCEIVDKNTVLTLLIAARRSLHLQGQIVTEALAERLDAETSYVLESCAVENHRREVGFAVATGFDAWRRLVDMTLVKCFSRLPRDRRETMLFDLLHELPIIMRSPTIFDATAILLSEVSLSLITKLREDRRSQLLVQSAGVDSDAGSLPSERLYALLRSLLECVLDHRIELVRGNLYATLINYFHLITSDTSLDISSSRANGLALSLSASANREDTMFSLNQSSTSLTLPSHLGRQSSPSSVLESGSLDVMKPVIERLVGTVSRDATDGTEVWKTVAFMLLDCLVHLARGDKQNVVLHALVRQGTAQNFVRGMKEADQRLQAVLKPDPDDLNALYVYEAKMSLFIRIAETRQGAERLLEARLLSILADCEYLDSRPEADQSFMDYDSFLPSAIQRYHQLFMPAVQLVVGILATLGHSHGTAARQALEFLSSHRDTIVILLKVDSEELSLPMLDEIHLLVLLCAYVLPQVPKNELLSGNTGFGSVHSAILSLAARSLGSGHWSQRIHPVTDQERQDASTPAPGYGSESKFDISIRQKEQLLRNALIVYIGTASDFTESEITLVLSPIMSTPRGYDQPSRVISTVPTVGDAIEALHDLCGDLVDTLNQIAGITAELSNKDHIRVENIQDIITLSDPDAMNDLDLGQRRYLICCELERICNRSRSRAKTLIASVEMLLLLLWRHSSYYVEGQHINNPSLKASTSGVMRHLASSTSADSDSFRGEAAKRLAPTLHRLGALDLDPESTGSDWRSNKAYIEIMCRRLRDTVGLHVEDEMSSSADGP